MSQGDRPPSHQPVVDTPARIASWPPGLPLCVSYAAIHCGLAQASVEQHRARTQRHLMWCFGTLSDGQSEALGVWSVDMPADTFAARVAGELAQRGLQRYSLLVNGASGELGSQLLHACPQAALCKPFHLSSQHALAVAPADERAVVAEVLSRLRAARSLAQAHAVLDEMDAATTTCSYASAQLVRAAFEQWSSKYSLSARAQDRLRRSEDSLWSMQQALTLALERRAPFDDPEAAAAFAATWLESAGRRSRAAVGSLSRPKSAGAQAAL